MTIPPQRSTAAGRAFNINPDLADHGTAAALGPCPRSPPWTLIRPADFDVACNRCAASFWAAQHATHLFGRGASSVLAGNAHSTRCLLLQVFYRAPHDAGNRAHHWTRNPATAQDPRKNCRATHQMRQDAAQSTAVRWRNYGQGG